VAQHGALSLDRWTQFTLDQQVVMIGNEMHRASKLLTPADRDRRRNAYERVLALVDLTIRANPKRGLRRELLRWRGLVAQLYIEDAGAPTAHAAALRALLQFTPVASRQIPHVTGSA